MAMSIVDIVQNQEAFLLYWVW